MVKPRELKEDADLLKASGHIEYEVNQLNDCIKRLALEEIHKSDPKLSNTLLTAFTVFARNVYQFLYAESSYPDDIIAEDYFNDPKFWQNHRPAKTLLLQEMNGRVNKLSAHLTYERIQLPDDYWWRWIEIHYDLRKTLKCFVAYAPPYRLDPALKSFEKDWEWTANLTPRPW